MLLQLKIIHTAKDGLPLHTIKQFDQQGGSLGRKVGNTWFLPDANRVLSSCHAELYSRQNSFYIRDLSTNGVFMNYAKTAIGKGGSCKLNMNDVICMGEYHLQVVRLETQNAAQKTELFDWQDGSPRTSEHALDPIDEILSRDPYPTEGDYAMPVAHTPSATPNRLDELLNLQAQSLDPLDALNNYPPLNVIEDDLASMLNNPSLTDYALMQVPNPNDPLAHSLDQLLKAPPILDTPVAANNITQFKPNPHYQPSTNGSRLQSNASLHVQPSMSHSAPKANAQMDFDSLESLLHTPIAAEPAYTPSPVAQAAPSAPKAPSTTAHGAEKHTDWHQFMLNEFGFDPSNHNHSQHPRAFFQTLADVTKESISGLLHALKSRSVSKHKLNMNMTRIQPLDNNPLKFSASMEDAMESLFLYNRKAFQNPVDAIRQGFADLALHQEAMMNAMELAFKDLLHEWSPQNMQRQRQRGFWAKLSWNKKAKNWRYYQQQHQEWTQDGDSAFKRLFLAQFVRHYEQQLSIKKQNS